MYWLRCFVWCCVCWAVYFLQILFFFFSRRRRHTILVSDWSSDVCSSDLATMISFGSVDPRCSSRDEPRDEQRVTTEPKEIIVAADALDPEQLTEQFRHTDLLGRR